MESGSYESELLPPSSSTYKMFNKRKYTYIFNEEIPASIFKPIVEIFPDFSENVSPVESCLSFRINNSDLIEESLQVF